MNGFEELKTILFFKSHDFFYCSVLMIEYFMAISYLIEASGNKKVACSCAFNRFL